MIWAVGWLRLSSKRLGYFLNKKIRLDLSPIGNLFEAKLIAYDS